MPFKVGPWELILVLAIVLIIFGAGKLPQIGGAIGKGIKEFRKGARGEFAGGEEEEPKEKETKGEVAESKSAAEKGTAPKAGK